MTGPVRVAARRSTALLALLMTAGIGSLGWLALLPAPAGAASRPCVGVVVDARLLGGDVRTGCARGDPDSGLEAMTRAGFSYAFVPRQPGLVCQVDRAPECSRTTTTTYWSYWYREKGSRTWVYSSAGAAAHDPAPGSTEAWVWQEGGRREPPDVSPVAGRPPAAPQRERSRTAAVTPAPVPPSENVPVASPSRRTTGQGSPTGTTAPTATAPPTTPPPPTPTPTSAAPSSATPTVDRTGAATAEGSAAGEGPGQAPWLGLLLGGGLVAAIGAAAFVRSRRSGGTP